MRKKKGGGRIKKEMGKEEGEGRKIRKRKERRNKRRVEGGKGKKEGRGVGRRVKEGWRRRRGEEEEQREENVFSERWCFRDNNLASNQVRSVPQKSSVSIWLGINTPGYR